MPLTKSVLIPLRLMIATLLATNAAIQKKIYRLGMIAQIIQKEEMDDFMKIV